MCGIAGYSGKSDAATVVLQALKELEYRGYDSWGIARSCAQGISLKKEVGKIGHVQVSDLGEGTCSQAIGHTRWATTGKVTQANAHPHLSTDKRFALVHNGIVENYADLKKRFTDYKTQTDTEVIVKLIEFYLNQDNDMKKAVAAAFAQLHGRNGIVVLDYHTKELIAIKIGSPLIVGMGKEEYILASDAHPILPYTREVVFLEDKEMVVLNQECSFYSLVDTSLEPIEKQPTTITWTVEQAQKGEYAHFMQKEIFEQQTTIAQALVQDKEKIERIVTLMRNAKEIVAIGCGTAGKVAQLAEYVFAQLAQKPVRFIVGSEVIHYKDLFTQDTLALAISQSGETADTLEALEFVKRRGGKVVSLVNVMGSSVMRASDETLLLNSGVEIAVCSTKATTAQMALVFLLGYALAGRYEEGLTLLKGAAQNVEDIFSEYSIDAIKKVGESLKEQFSLFIVGRGYHYPIALESAIKIQEVSYVHAQGFAAGEIKHGPLALIEEGTPCMVFVAHDKEKDNALATARELKARGGYIIGVGPVESEEFDAHLFVPDTQEVTCVLSLLPVQLLSYYMAIARGIDPDKPRNLAKSVTVK